MAVTVILVAATQVHAGVLEKLFAPKAKLWDTWTRHDPGSRSTIDHRAWDDFLRTHLMPGEDGVNRLDYAGVTGTGRVGLEAYIDMLASTEISSYTRDQQFAYWVNLYNALTVNVVLQHYPVDSIRDIKLGTGLFTRGPWSKKLVSVEGEELSLNDIEHRILRPIWKDPRIHYAVNCASVGCPNLAPRAYTAARLESMLDRAARDYINHPRGTEVRKGRLYVSSVYEWFQDDFGGSDAAVIAHLRRYADRSLAVDLQGIDTISRDGYDWTLNDIKRSE